MAPSRSFSWILLLCFFLMPGDRAHAQQDDPFSKKFQWQFIDNAYSASLPACQPLRVLVKSYNEDNSTHGTPPYYMFTLPAGGTPRMYPIGEKEDDLRWKLDFPVGTELMLTVLDANSSVGGISPRLYTSVPGSTTSCVKERDSPSNFTITANVTDTLNTCDPWGITVSGGVPPYMFTLAAVGSPVLTNVTSETDDQDTLTYINRADPDGQLLVAVSDVTGRFASGTPMVNTSGSKDYNCTGLVTTFGNSQQIKQQQQAVAQSAASKRQKKHATIGASCAVVALLLIVGALFLVRFLKRRKARLLGTDVDALPRKFELASPTTMSSSAYTNGDRPQTPSSSNFPSPTHRTTTTTTTTTTDSLPLSPLRKASHLHQQSRTSLREANVPQVERSPSGELYMQHRDGGGMNVVRELPPPYASPVAPAKLPRGAAAPAIKR
ncbi:hypothetical protein BDV98DRAFT_573106 [Pterulicium gracile]|uniref:Uncharacterized protein n=1 Tax=Pterulicium gracile TaxID=1884261 RepID=A0A5C3QE06_9AGAR|nr:hypothetical protein BDV98DRAFT_573106 [Pterula gracilis]